MPQQSYLTKLLAAVAVVAPAYLALAQSAASALVVDVGTPIKSLFAKSSQNRKKGKCLKGLVGFG